MPLIICSDCNKSMSDAFLNFADIPVTQFNGILVFTEKKPEPDGTWSIYNHCGVIDPNSIGHNTVSYGQVGRKMQMAFQPLPEPIFAKFVPEYVVLIP